MSDPFPCHRRIREKEYSAQFAWRPQWGPRPERIREYELSDYTTHHHCRPAPRGMHLVRPEFTYCHCLPLWRRPEVGYRRVL